VTLDETWLYHCDWRESNSQWSGGMGTHPKATKKSRVQNSAGKLLALNFWDQEGILLIYYLPIVPNYQRLVLFISAGASEGYFVRKNL
jgi:hypothetical protein